MRLRLLAIAATAVLLFAACGDDDDDAASPIADPDTTEDTADTGDGDGGGNGDVDLPGGAFTSEECEQFVEAIAGASTAFAGATDFGEVAEFYGEIADRVPEEIREDFETFAAAMTDFAEAAEDAGVDFSDPSTMTPDALQELSEEAERFSDEEVAQAGENLSAWGEENCQPAGG